MSEQSEREAYNEAAREDHEGREREAMDRPMFTQRDMDAAVQGEREAIIDALQALRDTDEKHEGTAVYGIGLAQAVVKARSSPAVDVMAVVREYVEAYDDYQEAINFKKTCRNDESVTVAADRRIKAGLALRALVDGKGEGKENER